MSLVLYRFPFPISVKGALGDELAYHQLIIGLALIAALAVLPNAVRNRGKVNVSSQLSGLPGISAAAAA